MTRQSRHKRRVTDQMLVNIYTIRRARRLLAAMNAACRRMSDAMAQAYAKAREEQT